MAAPPLSSRPRRRSPVGRPDRGPRRISIVVYPGVQTLDLTGPHEVFTMANHFVANPAGLPSLPPARSRAAGPAAPQVDDRGHRDDSTPAPYEIEVVARDVGADFTVRASSGLRLGVDRRIDPRRLAAVDRSIDTVMVAGGEGTVDAITDQALTAWLQRIAPTCRRVTSVCSGAYLLAAAGLLDGRRATTHWSECERLQAFFPAVQVEPDPIFVRDGNVITSAGVTAGMDLALAMVEEDLGREVALAVSRWLVMFVQRSGGQSQFSSQLLDQLADRDPLRELQGWIVDHPDEDLSVAALAGRVAMSPRHFARVFNDEVGTTPARYVERVRVEHARRLLESTDRTIEEVARSAGFGTVETLQRSFRRQVHTTPGEYRRHFTFAGGRPAVPSPTGALHA